MATIPQQSINTGPDVTETPFHVTAALTYARAGWSVLWLATDSSDGKIPPRNCERCDFKNGVPRHDMASCECLTCHGFHAATTDQVRIKAALDVVESRGRGAAHLAIRTGSASRLLVVDAEPGEGVENLDKLEVITGGEVGSLPVTLTARSVSGGLHLFYRLPDDVFIASGRVFPEIDIKAESGYVGAVDGRNTRTWVDVSISVADLPADLFNWLTKNRRIGTNGTAGSGSGGGYGAPFGYDYWDFYKNGAPGGHRDYFFNDLLFRARKRNFGIQGLMELAYAHWVQAEQPPDCKWEMPWEDVEGKVWRVFGEVVPNTLTDAQARWTAAALGHKSTMNNLSFKGTDPA